MNSTSHEIGGEPPTTPKGATSGAMPPTNTDPQGAVEVVTMLGDSVVAVSHLQPNRDRNAKRSALILYGIGALFLLVALVAFSKGVSNAATNKTARQDWTQVQKKSARSFTGTSLGAAWDYMAFGGLAFGIFTLGWGLVRSRGQNLPSSFSVEGQATPLVTEQAGQMVVNLPSDMDAELRTSQGITDKSQLAPSFAVPAQGSVRIASGPASFLIRSVPAPRTLPGLVTRFDSRAASFLGGSAIAHAILLLLMNTVSPDPRGVATELGTQDVRLTISESSPSEDDKVKPDPANDDGLAGSDEGNKGKPGEAGMAGNPDTKTTGGRIAIKRRSDDPSISRDSQVAAAREAGIIGVINNNKLFRDMSSDAWITSGLDDIDSYGPGSEPGDGGGRFGHHHTGFGPSGDGRDDGIVRTGRYRTNGDKGNNAKIPTSRNPGDLHHEPRGPDVDLREGTTDGELDEAIVRRYIQRKLRTIRNCYERELLAYPDLAGTLVTRFIIGPNGNVISSKAKGMHHSGLHSCVANVLSTIKFPKVEDGGIATVTYPFRFTSR